MDLCERVTASNEKFHFTLKDSLFDILIGRIDKNIKQVNLKKLS